MFVIKNTFLTVFGFVNVSMLVWQTRASPFAITVLDRPSGGARPQTAAPAVLAAGSICDAARQYGLFQTPLTVAGLQIQRQQVVVVNSFSVTVPALRTYAIFFAGYELRMDIFIFIY